MYIEIIKNYLISDKKKKKNSPYFRKLNWNELECMVKSKMLGEEKYILNIFFYNLTPAFINIYNTNK